MKKKIILLTSIFLMLSMFLASCSSGAEYDGGATKGEGYYGGAPVAPGDVSDQTGQQDQNKDVAPGQLTACAYNDNDNYSYWQGLISSNQEGKGQFALFNDQSSFRTENRIRIKVPTNMDVLVHLVNDNQVVLFTAVPDASGVAYLYPSTLQESYNICLEYVKVGEEEVTKQYEVVSEDTEYVIDATYNKQDLIQLMFVIDTTGSMGDEIRYLKSEIIDIIAQIKNEYSNSMIELAIMLYRDVRDEYVTKYSDFSTDISSQQSFLAKQNANGGGDFPEAVDIALDEAANKQWNSNAKTKILVHVADAPAHEENVEKWSYATNKLAKMGVRVITVASSGIDTNTEYLFRCQSIITNGTYVYLTDDSGIGGSHLEATVEKRPVVEYLNSCLVRLIKGYHTGVFDEPIYYGQETGNNNTSK